MAKQGQAEQSPPPALPFDIAGRIAPISIPDVTTVGSPRPHYRCSRLAACCDNWILPRCLTWANSRDRFVVGCRSVLLHHRVNRPWLPNLRLGKKPSPPSLSGENGGPELDGSAEPSLLSPSNLPEIPASTAVPSWRTRKPRCYSTNPRKE